MLESGKSIRRPWRQEGCELSEIPTPPLPAKEVVRLLSDLCMDWDIASSPPTLCRGKPRLVSYRATRLHSMHFLLCPDPAYAGSEQSKKCGSVRHGFVG